jgi:hypothetical protein
VRELLKLPAVLTNQILEWNYGPQMIKHLPEFLSGITLYIVELNVWEATT